MTKPGTPPGQPGKTGVRNLTKTAYLAIKNDIMLNKIKPGECLSGCRLAKKLNMSRTPVREAISILENEGFVEVRNGAGIFIRELTEKDVMELVAARIVLECGALECGALKLDREVLENLLNAWEKMKTDFLAGAEPDLEEVVSLDYETHDFLVASSGNTYLIDLRKNVAVRFRRIQCLSVMALNDLPDTIEQHLALLRRVRDGRLEEASRLLRAHIQGVGTYVFRPAERRRRARRR